MTDKASPNAGSFEAAFRSRMDALFLRANKAGMSVTAVCKEAGIARATPDRWRKKAPLSIQLVDQMEQVVARHEEAKAAASI